MLDMQTIDIWQQVTVIINAALAAVLGSIIGWERDRAGIAVTVIETGDATQDVLAVYAAALEQQDMVVGPLARGECPEAMAFGCIHFSLIKS